MSLYVIADLHLCEKTPQLIKAFEEFAKGLSCEDELYILGDLFNFFIGLDRHDAAQQSVRETLKELRQRNVKCFFVRGNRDFLMNAKEAASLNMTLADDFIVRSRGGVRLALTHGDLFCTNDTGYMRYRRLVNNALLQRIFRLMPMALRRKIASSLREKSKNADRHVRGSMIYGVVEQSVDDMTGSLLGRAGSDLSECRCGSDAAERDMKTLVVHGHIHEFSKHGGGVNYDARYVLGAWGGSLSYFRLDVQGDDAVIDFQEVPLGSDVCRTEKHEVVA